MSTTSSGFTTGNALLFLHCQLKAFIQFCWILFTGVRDGARAELHEFLSSIDNTTAQNFLSRCLTAEENALATLSLLSLLASLILIFLVAPCVSYIRHCQSQAFNTQQFRLPLQALITVITPTESRWPAYYSNVARRTCSARDSCICISLSRLWNDLLSGNVELLRPELSLPDLIMNGLHAYGWKLRFTVDSGWTMGCMLRVYAIRLASFLPQWTVSLPRTTKYSPQVDTSSAPPVLMLDDVPYYSLTAYIRAFQRSLPPGTSAIVGFSALGTSPLTTSQLAMVAKPFLPRKYVRKSASKSPQCLPQSVRRTLTPVLTRLESILQILSGGPDRLVVQSVQNVSESYTLCLHEYVTELAGEGPYREKFVAQWGMEGWREEVLTGQWEAALLSAQMLKRWLVVVKKRRVSLAPREARIPL